MEIFEISDIVKVGGGLIAGLALGYVAGAQSRSAPDQREKPTIGDNTPPLSADNLVEILKSLAEAHRTLHEERIKRELQVVLATVGLFVAAVALKYTEKGLPTTTPFRVSVWIGVLGLAFGAFVYLKSSNDANRINQRAAEVAENLLGDLLKKGGIKGFSQSGEPHPARLRWLWQALMIIVSGILAGYLISCT